MAKIIGLGQWFPETVRTNDAWSQDQVDAFTKHLQRELVDVFDQNSVETDPYSAEGFQSEMMDPFVGSVERRVADPNYLSYQAEINAAEVAIVNSGIDRKEIEAIFSWAVVPDIVNLTQASKIGQELGIENFFGFGVEGACVSFVAQLMIAKGLIDSGQVKYALLTQSHLMTQSFPLSHPASPNLGDASTAILVGPDSHEGHAILALHARSHGEHHKSVAWRRREGDNQSWLSAGGPYYLGTFDRKLAKELVLSTVQLGAKTVEEALSKIGANVKDINYFISVNPRKWIPSAICKQMGISPDKTLNTFERYAHLGGCGTIVNLIEAEQQGKLKQGDTVALYAQGSGFTRGSVILKW